MSLSARPYQTVLNALYEMLRRMIDKKIPLFASTPVTLSSSRVSLSSRSTFLLTRSHRYCIRVITAEKLKGSALSGSSPSECNSYFVLKPLYLTDVGSHGADVAFDEVRQRRNPNEIPSQ